MAALLKLLLGSLLDAIISRLPGWLEELHKRQAAAAAAKKLTADKQKILDFVNAAKPKEPPP